MNKLNWKQAWALKCQFQRPADRLPRGIKAVKVEVEGPVEVDFEAINAGHGTKISPTSHVPAGFERLQRIYAESDAVTVVTSNMKIILL